MQIALYIGIVLGTIVAMELFSWFIHKYLFHGPLWFIHRTHHQANSSWFELNDLFSLFFGAISIYLIWEGHSDLSSKFWFGTGIAIYGIIYFVFHDWFIHNRYKSFKTKNAYLLAIRRAHKIHHKSLKKSPSTEFGLLFTSKKHFRPE